MAARRTAGWVGGMTMVLLCGASIHGRAAPAAEPRIYIADAEARGAVARAVAGAVHRLNRPDCRRVLDDFADAHDESLGAMLAALDLTPGAYLLSWLWFVDGSDTPHCWKDDGPAAFTAPGHRAIRVCARRFASRAPRDARWAELIVIHELLHTLGLGENPPSSADITRQVTRRCGRS